MYLLDTTHCIWLLNAKPNFEQKLDKLDSDLLSTCIIVCGELLYGAIISEQSNENLRDVYEFIKNLKIYELDINTAKINAILKASILNHFGPKEKNKRRKTKIESLGFKENDIWIASVAIQHKLVLVSADSDLLRLNGIEGLQVENW